MARQIKRIGLTAVLAALALSAGSAAAASYGLLDIGRAYYPGGQDGPSTIPNGGSGACIDIHGDVVGAKGGLLSNTAFLHLSNGSVTTFPSGAPTNPVSRVTAIQSGGTLTFVGWSRSASSSVVNAYEFFGGAWQDLFTSGNATNATSVAWAINSSGTVVGQYGTPKQALLPVP